MINIHIIEKHILYMHSLCLRHNVLGVGTLMALAPNVDLAMRASEWNALVAKRALVWHHRKLFHIFVIGL